MLAFVVGLRAEARLVDGHVFIGGGHSEGAARAAARAIDAGATGLVSFGLAGGLSPDLPAGAMAVTRAVLWGGRRFTADRALSVNLGGSSVDLALACETVVARAGEKARLWHATGAAVVDLESGPVAEAAERACIPFATLRAVCDPAWRDLPPAALAALDGAGLIGIGRVIGSMLRQPRQVGSLLALARDAALARHALTVHLAKVKADGGLRGWG